MVAGDGRLERWEGRLERLAGAVPYALLALATLVTVLDGGHAAPGGAPVTLGLAALAAGWMLAPTAARRRGRADLAGPPAVGYVAGLVVLIAALNTRSIWFATFFVFVGYLHSWRYLSGGWRFAGVAATAAVSVPHYLGGPPDPARPGTLLTYLLVVGVITSMVGLFSLVGEVTAARSAERRRMVARLEELLHENAGLQAQLLVAAREAGVLDERQRMAREIHDTLAQSLTGIITQLQAAERAADGPGADPAVWRRHLGNAVRLARDGLAEARRTVDAVRPGPLRAARLPDALTHVAADWSRLSGVPAEVTVTGEPRPLHPEAETTVLRVAQEALANVAKHADATRVGVTLSYMADLLALDVRDDGAGFDTSRPAAGRGFGLTSMRQRAERLGGTFTIESEPGAGTAVSATVPAIPPVAAAADRPPAEAVPGA
ncbi:MAG: sensor histidine kinase [Actinomycetes bacterium]|jgi:signal transduction histidine kinase|nr:MAG: two-component sensor histidine kinase [Actinomycetota bacterium]